MYNGFFIHPPAINDPHQESNTDFRKCKFQRNAGISELAKLL